MVVQWLIVAALMISISKALSMFAQPSSFKRSFRWRVVSETIVALSLQVLAWSLTSSSGGETGSCGEGLYHFSCVSSSIVLMISGVNTLWSPSTISMKFSSFAFWKGMKFASMRLRTKLFFVIVFFPGNALSFWKPRLGRCRGNLKSGGALVENGTSQRGDSSYRNYCTCPYMIYLGSGCCCSIFYLRICLGCDRCCYCHIHHGKKETGPPPWQKEQMNGVSPVLSI